MDDFNPDHWPTGDRRTYRAKRRRAKISRLNLSPRSIQPTWGIILDGLDTSGKPPPRSTEWASPAPSRISGCSNNLFGGGQREDRPAQSGEIPALTGVLPAQVLRQEKAALGTGRWSFYPSLICRTWRATRPDPCPRRLAPAGRLSGRWPPTLPAVAGQSQPRA